MILEHQNDATTGPPMIPDERCEEHKPSQAMGVHGLLHNKRPGPHLEVRGVVAVALDEPGAQEVDALRGVVAVERRRQHLAHGARGPRPIPYHPIPPPHPTRRPRFRGGHTLSRREEKNTCGLGI